MAYDSRLFRKSATVAKGPAAFPAFHSRSASSIIRSKYLVGLYGTENAISLSRPSWRKKALIMVPSGIPSSSAARFALNFTALSVLIFKIVFIYQSIYFGINLSMWARGDSNSQPLQDTLLRRARIPIPPRAQDSILAKLPMVLNVP